MTDIITPEPGWYPDPTDSRAYRWWSGGAWTDHLTAAPTAESVWSDTSTSGPAAFNADQFAPSEQSENSFTSSYEEPWNNTDRPAGPNRTGAVVAVIGVVSLALYGASLAFSFSTVIALVPGILGLVLAVPAFMQARITGNGLGVSLLGVLLSAVGSGLAIIPLLPLLLGLPSQSDINNITTTVNSTVGFHTAVQSQIVARATTDFGQAATAAACPADALPTVGSSFLCTETLADGSQKAVTVTVTSAAGGVTWVPAA